MTQTLTLEDLVRRFQALVQEWNKKNHNVELCSEKVKEITSSLTRFTYLPKEEGEASRRELFIARDTLEIACFLALEQRDIPLFEHYIAQLKCYYYDYKSTLPESAVKYELLGLNLLRLLAQNKLADFHTELERLSIEEITSNLYINHPVSMEQYLMEGNFQRVFLSKDNVPSRRYDFFIDILLNTTRNEVASCIEAAYDSLSLDEAARTLFYDDPQSMLSFGQTRNWTLDKNNVYHFQKDTRQEDDSIPSADVTKVMLEYTKELDQII
ncbi:Epididymis secretory sperm binding protein Li 91n [Paragonimus heterotremus]|uniref:26S proteasome non-ATPase regulatory subunit 8 n=1 Tax=Paragonimus heterotremus TaxID=100268 RepID=A0A8J4WQM3_9TREM|nr:Epididymis secretory sperm binding protein Li 91n [Paragonimus heterotremus]